MCAGLEPRVQHGAFGAARDQRPPRPHQYLRRSDGRDLEFLQLDTSPSRKHEARTHRHACTPISCPTRNRSSTTDAATTSSYGPSSTTQSCAGTSHRANARSRTTSRATVVSPGSRCTLAQSSRRRACRSARRPSDAFGSLPRVTHADLRRGSCRAPRRWRSSRRAAYAGSHAVPRRGSGAPRRPGTAGRRPPRPTSMCSSPAGVRTVNDVGQCMNAGSSTNAFGAGDARGARHRDPQRGLHDAETATGMVQHCGNLLVDARLAHVALRDHRVGTDRARRSTAAPDRCRGRGVPRRRARGRSAGSWDRSRCANRSRPRRGVAHRCGRSRGSRATRRTTARSATTSPPSRSDRARARRCTDVARLRGVQRERLLAQHVLAGFEVAQRVRRHDAGAACRCRRCRRRGRRRGPRSRTHARSRSGRRTRAPAPATATPRPPPHRRRPCASRPRTRCAIPPVAAIPQRYVLMAPPRSRPAVQTVNPASEIVQGVPCIRRESGFTMRGNPIRGRATAADKGGPCARCSRPRSCSECSPPAPARPAPPCAPTTAR